LKSPSQPYISHSSHPPGRLAFHLRHSGEGHCICCGRAVLARFGLCTLN
jgi:hypothetical protein